MTDPHTSPHRVDLLALAERCEKASGPDRELDADIFEAVSGASAYRDTHGFSGGIVRKRMQGLPAYTESTDAALSLLPDGAGFMLNRYWIAKSEDPVWSAHITTGGVPDNPSQSFEAMDAHSAALATTSAALKAKARTGGSSHGR